MTDQAAWPSRSRAGAARGAAKGRCSISEALNGWRLTRRFQKERNAPEGLRRTIAQNLETLANEKGEPGLEYGLGKDKGEKWTA